MEQKPIKVYARAGSNNKVYRLLDTAHHQNDILPTDIFVDEGFGDNYAYPHILYTILDANGCHNYKIADGRMAECTPEDKEDELAARPKPEPADQEIVNAEILLSLAKQQEDLAAIKESNTAIEETTAVLLLQAIGGEENV